MPNEVSTQIDISHLTLQGLSSFTSLLATLSADDVSPMAMIQMENLGAAFPTNGKYAAQVPDYLQRCSSSRLDRIGFVVGWRKGDSASLMAKSAGGQAIALLSTCLLVRHVGDVLLGLSQRILPASITVSSGSQLGQVAKHLSAKLAVVGFGNLLAHQVSRIQDVYEQLQQPTPSDLLDDMTTESAIDLLHAISRALREEDLLVRISGTQAAGYILGLVITMFPHDCIVTVHNFIVHEGQRKKIIIEFGVEGQSQPTEIRLESVLKVSQTVSLPVIVEPREPKILGNAGFFRWEGWLADRLQLIFGDQGVRCSEQLLIACSSLLILLSTAMKGNTLYNSILLGSYPRDRMTQICQKLLKVPLIEPRDTMERAFVALVDVFRSDVEQQVSCSCDQTKATCNLLHGWDPSFDRPMNRKQCGLRILWQAVGRALDDGLAAFFIDADTDATIRDHKAIRGFGLATLFLDGTFERKHHFIDCQDLHNRIMESIFFQSALTYGHPSSPDLVCSDSSTLYPILLRDMSLRRQSRVTYELLDGKLQLNGRYHTVLRNAVVAKREEATQSLYAHEGIIKPSCSGEISELLLTVRERSEVLELRCEARCSGMNISLNLAQAIVASYCLIESEQCEHCRTEPLSSDRASNVMTTSVATPRAQGTKIAVVQTAGNEYAQLLSCELGVPALIQRYSCLNCAYDQAMKGKFTMIIVG